MFAIGIDADNSYYPIAYAIVEKECYITWFWFLSLLKVDLKLDEDFRITFMTDKQKGLVEAIREIWKNSEHRNCVRHLYANFKKKFKTYEIRTKVWEAAKATTVEDFNRVMTKIKDMNEKAHEWLCEKPIEQWSKSHF
ncbi:hypothetical protein Ddye_012772 [Dipteronia dyeriana]|uniref:MULE transposase domain-containing protein n=1 Tax=Dipteronia dyeriana TaxID=168575 RepID=A0AAE0CJ00_9ROSI|nr:hypothetical protein Ddye_012772 [Dipteronia dyeriana]